MEVETDCFELCRQETTCLGWGFYWAPDLSIFRLLIFCVFIFVFKGKSGTCYLKGVLAQPSSDQREGFVAGWKGGQNIFIDKGKVHILSIVNNKWFRKIISYSYFHNI